MKKDWCSLELNQSQTALWKGGKVKGIVVEGKGGKKAEDIFQIFHTMYNNNKYNQMVFFVFIRKTHR